MSDSPRKIFIEPGAYDGAIVINHNNTHEDFTYYMFECNPKFDDILKDISEKNENIFYTNKAAWISNDNKKYYIGEGDQLGGSLFEEKKFATKRNVDIKCFDFSEWVMYNVGHEDYAVLNMDIELSEYYILTKMIKEKTINLFNEITIEFHKKKIVNKETSNKILYDDCSSMHESIVNFFMNEGKNIKTKLYNK